MVGAAEPPQVLLHLVPQDAVAAAAAASALTASRLGASPEAFADAVAAAVHNVWRWVSPTTAGEHGCPIKECEADNIEAWYASACDLDASQNSEVLETFSETRASPDVRKGLGSVAEVDDVSESVFAIAASCSCEVLASGERVKEVNEVNFEITACYSSENPECAAVVNRVSKSDPMISSGDGITLLKVLSNERAAGAMGMHIELAQWGDLAAACPGFTCLKKFPVGLPRPPEELGRRQKSGRCLRVTQSDTSTIAPVENDVLHDIEVLEGGSVSPGSDEGPWSLPRPPEAPAVGDILCLGPCGASETEVGEGPVLLHEKSDKVDIAHGWAVGDAVGGTFGNGMAFAGTISVLYWEDSATVKIKGRRSDYDFDIVDGVLRDGSGAAMRFIERTG